MNLEIDLVKDINDCERIARSLANVDDIENKLDIYCSILASIGVLISIDEGIIKSKIKIKSKGNEEVINGQGTGKSIKFDCLRVFRLILGKDFRKYELVKRAIQIILDVENKNESSGEKIHISEDSIASITDSNENSVLISTKYGILMILKGFLLRNLKSNKNEKEENKPLIAETDTKSSFNHSSKQALFLKFIAYILPLLVSYEDKNVIVDEANRKKMTALTSLCNDVSILCIHSLSLNNNGSDSSKQMFVWQLLWDIRQSFIGIVSIQRECIQTQYGISMTTKSYQELQAFLEALVKSNVNDPSKSDVIIAIFGETICESFQNLPWILKTREIIISTIKRELDNLSNSCSVENQDKNNSFTIVNRLRSICFLLGNLSILQETRSSTSPSLQKKLGDIIEEIGSLHLIQTCMNVIRMKNQATETISQVPNFIMTSIDTYVPLLLSLGLMNHMKSDSDIEVFSLLNSCDTFSVAGVELVVHRILSYNSKENDGSTSSSYLNRVLEMLDDQSNDEQGRNRKSNILLIVKRVLESVSHLDEENDDISSLKTSMALVLLKVMESEKILPVRKMALSLFSFVNPTLVIPKLTQLANHSDKLIQSLASEAICASISQNRNISLAVSEFIGILQSNASSDRLLDISSKWAALIPESSWEAVTNMMLDKYFASKDTSSDFVALFRITSPFYSVNAIQSIYSRLSVILESQPITTAELVDSFQENKEEQKCILLSRLSPLLILRTIKPRKDVEEVRLPDKINYLLHDRMISPFEFPDVKHLSADILAQLALDVDKLIVGSLKGFSSNDLSIVQIRSILYCLCQYLITDSRFIHNDISDDLFFETCCVMDHGMKSDKTNEDVEKLVMACTDCLSILIASDMYRDFVLSQRIQDVQESETSTASQSSRRNWTKLVLDRLLRKQQDKSSLSLNIDSFDAVDVQLCNILVITLRSFGFLLSKSGTNTQPSSLLEQVLRLSPLGELEIKQIFIGFSHRVFANGLVELEHAASTGNHKQAITFSVLCQLYFTLCFYIQKLTISSQSFPISDRDVSVLHGISLDAMQKQQTSYPALKLMGVILTFPDDILDRSIKAGAVGKTIDIIQSICNISESKEVQNIAQQILAQLRY